MDMRTVLECCNCLHYRPGGVASALCIECANSQGGKINFTPASYITTSDPGIGIADRILAPADEGRYLAQAVESHLANPFVHMGDSAVPRYTCGWDLAYGSSDAEAASSSSD